MNQAMQPAHHSLGKDAIRAMWYRLMDAVDPHLFDLAERAILKNLEVNEINYLRMRWIGCSLHLESCIKVDSNYDFARINKLRNSIDQELIKELPYLAEITISISPQYP